jgi:multiple sugar transport system substrate-binding protein
VPYADYFATLPDTLAAGTADDVSWLNSSYFGELADRGAPDGTFAFAVRRGVPVPLEHDQPGPGGPARRRDRRHPDFSRDRFIAGRLGPFRSGTYNLKNVADGAGFEWGIAPMVAGPAGRVSVVNSVIAAGNARTAHPEAVARVLGWLGSTDGAAPIGTSGAASPAVTDAQQGFFDHWQGRGVDTRWFGEAGGTATVEARRARGSAPGGKAFQPVLSEVFAGRTPVGPGLQAAQDAADAAIR